jgi:hypothetical protein
MIEKKCCLNCYLRPDCKICHYLEDFYENGYCTNHISKSEYDEAWPQFQRSPK